MGRPRKTAAAAAETAQEAQEQQDMSQDTQGQETATEAAQEAAETAQDAQERDTEGQETTAEAAQGTVTQEIIGPDDPADLLGCEDADEAELAEGLLTEYAVTSKGGLRLREEPSVESPIIAVLPQGAGVLACEGPEDGWLYVRTGRLEGWMMAKHLEAMPLPEWPSLGSGKLPYDLE